MYTFEFKYDWFNSAPDRLEAPTFGRRKDDKQPISVRHTRVTIYMGSAVLAEGKITQHPRDQDVKETARKVAIKNALAPLNLTQAMRADIWRNYFAR